MGVGACGPALLFQNAHSGTVDLLVWMCLAWVIFIVSLWLVYFTKILKVLGAIPGRGSKSLESRQLFLSGMILKSK